MIVPQPRFKTACQYRLASRSEKEVERPVRCPNCRKKGGFWRHGLYVRHVREKGLKVRVEIYRFLCRYCRRTISRSYAFSVPYRHFSVREMGQVIESYTVGGDSYLEVATGVSVQHEGRKEGCMAPEQVFRWVKFIAEISETLLAQIQRYLIQRGAKHWNLPAPAESPSAVRAKNDIKAAQLNGLASFIRYGDSLESVQQNICKLSNLFLDFTETRRWLLSPHTLHCALF